MTRSATAAPTEPDLGQDEALFVYAVVRAGPQEEAHGTVSPHVTDGLTGLDGAPLRLVACGPVAAAVTPVALDRPAGRGADLTAYQGVVSALAEVGPVVPVRFGSVLSDVEAVVEEFLLPEGPRFAETLDRFEGRRQYNLRATYVEEAVLADLVAANPEIRGLRDRTRNLPEDASYRERVRLGELVAGALEHQSGYDAATLLDTVVPLAVHHLVRTAPSATQVLDVALLVDDARAEELVDALEALAEAVHERIRLRLLGPLAPFDFAEEGGWD